MPEMSCKPLVTALVLLTLPAGASAQGRDGVTYDEDSPAGKEYALPIDAARTIGSGRAPGAGGAGRGETTAAADTALFGTGITASAGSSGGGVSARGRTRQPTATKAAQQAVTSPRLRTSSGSEVIAAATGPGAFTLGAGVVLIAGAGALMLGLGYRRRRRPPAG
jgi:hypothetical protein